MKLLKNIVITVGLLFGFVQANAMNSKVNKVFLGTWENKEDDTFFISNPYSNPEMETIILPAHSKTEINRELTPHTNLTIGTMAIKNYYLAFDYDQVKNEHDYELVCTLEENPSQGFHSFNADFSKYQVAVANAALDLSQFTQKKDIYIDGIIKYPTSMQTRILLRPKPFGVSSLTEQSMKATIQKLKNEGKSFEEAKKIIPHDLHELLLENWNL